MIVFECDDPVPCADDAEFEVTAEMLIHDTIDDEATLAEEEALQTLEENEEELSGLQEVRIIKFIAAIKAPPTIIMYACT